MYKIWNFPCHYLRLAAQLLEKKKCGTGATRSRYPGRGVNAQHWAGTQRRTSIESRRGSGSGAGMTWLLRAALGQAPDFSR